MHPTKFFPSLLCAPALCIAFLTTAHSAVIYSGLRNATNPAPPPLPYTSRSAVDLDGQGGPELALVSRIIPFSNGEGFLAQMSFIPSLDFVAGSDMSLVLAMLGVDTLIGNNSVFSLRDETTVANSQSGIPGSRGSSGYFGFRFNPSGDQTLYGWGRIIIDNLRHPAAGANFTLTDWAYDDTGGPILAGQVPEFSGAALAGLAATLGLRRSRRGKQGS